MNWRMFSLPEKLTSATRGLIYLLVFFLPLWFLPFTSDVLEVNKQMLFLVLTFASTLTWIGSMLFARKFSVQCGWINLLPLFIVISVGMSAWYSWAPHLSWLGSSMQEYVSFMTILGCGVLFYLLVNVFSDRSTHRTLHSVLLSSALATGVIGLTTLSGVLNSGLFGFSQSVFNTIGTVNAFAVYLSVMSVFGGALYVTHRKDDALLHQGIKGTGERAVIVGLWMITVVVLLALDYWVLWTIWLVGMTSLFVFGYFRAKDFERTGRMWMPALSIMIALGWLLWIPTPFQFTIPSEVTPSYKTSLELAKQPMSFDGSYGTGPGTYVLDYAQFHSKAINQTDFWNTRFDRASSFVLTILPTYGYLGTFAFAIFVLILLIRSLTQMLKPTSREEWLQAFVVFSPWLTLVVAGCLYAFNITLVVLFFLLAGLLGSQVIRKPYTKSYAQSPALALLFSFLFVSGSVLMLVGIFISSERYIAEIAFASALKLDAKNGSVQEIVKLLDTASTLNRYDDRYYRTLAEALLVRVGEQMKTVSSTSQMTPESKQYIQSLVAASVNAAARATELSTMNSLNWSTRGRIYRELMNVLPDASKFAIEAHKTAVDREPVNPRVWTDLGKTYLAAAEQQRSMTVVEDKEVAKKAQNTLELFLKNAEDAFQKAVEYKSNYAPAHFQIGLVYERQGRLDEAIAKITSVLAYNPVDVGVLFELGQLYLRRDQAGDLNQAQKQFEQVVELSPSYSNARWYLASVYERLGETSKAIEQIEAVVKLNPDNAVVKTRLDRLLRGDKNEPDVMPLPEPGEQN